MTYSFVATAVILLVSIVSTVIGYSVSGNKIYDTNGNQVIIRGIDRPSLEWNAAGEQLSLNDYTLMKNWGSKVNVIRVSINQDTWLGSAGSAYQNTVNQQVTWITSNLGLGCILDLHWNNGGQQNMADRKSITFWASVAAKFKGNLKVIFELYNEPHDVSWSVWKSGDGSYAGMQELYNAVRGAGANNLVIVCGLNWAFDLSGVSSGYAISGTNIAYGTHPYDYGGKQSADWPAAFGNLASTYPVIMTEFGQYCSTNNYVKDLLTYAESKGIHWTAWAWYAKDCAFPSIIADWSGTPTTVGAVIKGFLQGSASATTKSATATTKSATSTTKSATSSTTKAATTGSGSTTGSASTTQKVYVDAIQSGWADWSWSTNKNLAATPARSGKSISFALQKYEALYFHANSPLTITNNFKLQFYAYATTAQAASNVKTLVYSSGTATGNQPNIPLQIPANAWTLISVPLSSYGVSTSTKIDGFAIQATNGAASSILLYVDDITLTL